MARLRQIVWSLVFFADRGAEEGGSCGTALAAVVVVLGVVVMVGMLGLEMLPGFGR